MNNIFTQSLWKANPDDANPTLLPIGDLIAQCAELYPQQEAVVYACHDEVENIRWTFSQLNEMANRLAFALISEGYQCGDKLAIWAPNNPEWTLLEYAFAKAGLVIVALNPLYKKTELEFALNTSGVKGIFHADQVAGTSLRSIIDDIRPMVATLKGVHSLTTGIPSLLKKHTRSVPLPKVDPDDCFMIQYTSGTTGQPKAAQLSHRGVATIARNTYRTWKFSEGDRVCHGFPLYHVGGSGNSTPGSALVGATTLPLYIFKAKRTLDIIEQERCTGFIGVPSMLSSMMEDPTFKHRDFSSLKYIVIGGASVPTRLINECEQAFGVEIINGYGQTETSGVSCSTVPSDSADVKSLTSGRALPGVSLKVVDDNGDILPCSRLGELCYQGPGQMIGYRNHPNPLKVIDKDGWLRSGDLAKMNEDGYITIVGRAKEMIIRGGENLSPSEIEAFLLQHPDICEAAVIGLPDRKYGEEVCAVLVSKSETHVTPDEIRLWCSENLSRWKVPKYVTFIQEFPKTTSGKIQKFLLKKTMTMHFHIDQPNNR